MITLEQHTFGNISSGGTIAFTSNVKAGSTLVIYVVTGASAAITITDTQGNTWTTKTIEPNSAANAWGAFAYTFNAKAGATTVTFTQATGGGSIALMEFSGCLVTNPFDQEAVNNGNSTAPTTGSLTPALDNSVIVSGMGLNFPTTSTPSDTNGDNQTNSGTLTQPLATQYQVQTTKTAHNASWSPLGTSRTWMANAIVLKPAVPSAGFLLFM